MRWLLLTARSAYSRCASVKCPASMRGRRARAARPSPTPRPSDTRTAKSRGVDAQRTPADDTSGRRARRGCRGGRTPPARGAPVETAAARSREQAARAMRQAGGSGRLPGLLRVADAGRVREHAATSARSVPGGARSPGWRCQSGGDPSRVGSVVEGEHAARGVVARGGEGGRRSRTPGMRPRTAAATARGSAHGSDTRTSALPRGGRGGSGASRRSISPVRGAAPTRRGTACPQGPSSRTS